MSKELQELRNQRDGDHLSTASGKTDMTPDSLNSLEEEDGPDDFELKATTLGLNGVLVKATIAVESFKVYDQEVQSAPKDAHHSPDLPTSFVLNYQSLAPLQSTRYINRNHFCSGPLLPSPPLTYQDRSTLSCIISFVSRTRSWFKSRS